MASEPAPENNSSGTEPMSELKARVLRGVPVGRNYSATSYQRSAGLGHLDLDADITRAESLMSVGMTDRT